MKFQQKHNQKQAQTQVQKLAMTQQLQQAIKILQFNTEDLMNYVDEQIMENPLIETTDSIYSKGQGMAPDVDYMQQIPANEQSLFDYLIEQIHLNYRDTFLRSLTLFLVEFIDLNGFLTISLEEAAEKTGGNAIQMLDALTLIQQLDPAGVGARDLRECLMLQTERDDQSPELAYIVIEEFFSELAERKWEVIAKHFKISLADVQQIFDYVQTLTPTPGAAFARIDGLYIIPELTVLVVNEEVRIKYNRSSMPEIKLQQNYFEKMKESEDPEVLSYLAEKQQDFEWLKKTVEQRGDTILRVGQAIVEHQQTFFLDKEHPLQPLTMREIAEELDLHESTVSRAVNGKFLETDFGVFEFKTFFTQRIVGASGEDTATSEVKKQLQSLIQDENKQKPLSDQKLADLLTGQGMAISRRTVAKYREQLKIPGSTKRKRYD